MIDPLSARSYFFDQGLRFACQCCGACCTGAPGVVRVSPAEAADIARHLMLATIPPDQPYLLPWSGGWRLNEQADGRCVFYGQGCSIYPVRPAQCRCFPFWLANLRSEDNWRRLARECPGIGKGPLVARQRILDLVRTSPL